jgi:hypothetical protein
MPQKGWRRKFEDQIELPDGRKPVLAQSGWRPLDLLHVIMRNRSPVAVVPVNGDSVPSRFDYCAKIRCRGSPANTVTYFEKSGLFAGHRDA